MWFRMCVCACVCVRVCSLTSLLECKSIPQSTCPCPFWISSKWIQFHFNTAFVCVCVCLLTCLLECKSIPQSTCPCPHSSSSGASYVSRILLHSISSIDFEVSHCDLKFHWPTWPLILHVIIRVAQSPIAIRTSANATDSIIQCLLFLLCGCNQSRALVPEWTHGCEIFFVGDLATACLAPLSLHRAWSARGVKDIYPLPFCQLGWILDMAVWMPLENL